jgi:hypothetical protein
LRPRVDRRYEAYKAATSIAEYYQLGGNIADFKYDYARSYVTVDWHTVSEDLMTKLESPFLTAVPVAGGSPCPFPPTHRACFVTARFLGSKRSLPQSTAIPQQPKRKRTQRLFAGESPAPAPIPSLRRTAALQAVPVLDRPDPQTLISDHILPGVPVSPRRF